MIKAEENSVCTLCTNVRNGKYVRMGKEVKSQQTDNLKSKGAHLSQMSVHQGSVRRFSRALGTAPKPAQQTHLLLPSLSRGL